MALSNRLNKAELSGFLIDDNLSITGDLVSDNLGTGGILTIGEKGIDGYSPVVTIEYISGSESSTGLDGYKINITDAEHSLYGQDFYVWNGNSIERVELNEDYTFTIYFTDGSSYRTPDELKIQPKLTSENAGDGISIEEDSSGKVIISNTNVSAEWGNIQGNISDQTDLVEYINEFGGKIDSISVNGVEQVIDSAKNVNLDLTVFDCGTSIINV